jgi:lipoprotein-anchoring transpeptidase ErfK/SrfK
MRIDHNRYIIALIAVLVAAFSVGCSRTPDVQDQASEVIDGQNLSIEATPLKPGDGSFQIATSETVAFTVTAPEAREVRLLHSPVSSAEGYFVLTTITESLDAGRRKFTAQVKLTPDFAGDVWAEAVYPDGSKKQTLPITLILQTAEASEALQNPTGSTESPATEKESMVTPDEESARSDKLRSGKVEKASLKEGRPDITISINAPAFLLTLWQDGKEVKTYDVGIGRKNFPIVIGERQVKEIIFNPNWVPPNSEWVRESAGVEPYERIEAGDPRNPLGSLKIPLGDAYLIHEAAKPSDIGNLVSHGCVRMLKEDIFDLAEKIIAARSLPLSKREIEALKSSNDRRVLRLDTPLLVDINYDTQVVEGGVLHIYPDVYDRQTNRAEELRIELQQVGVDASHLDEKTIKMMVARASMTEEYVVSIADIKAGRGQGGGKNQPLTGQPASEKKSEKNQARPGANRRRR